MPVKRYNGSTWDVVAGTGVQGATGSSGTAPLTTKGDLLGFDTAANRIAVGTNGQVLTVDSTQALGVKWGNGGKVLQVVNVPYGTYGTTTSSTFAATGLSASITPSATTSKVLVMVTMNGIAKMAGDTGVGFQILRGATKLQDFAGVLASNGVSQANHADTSNIYLDSPATTSSTTYSIYWNSFNNSTQCRINDNGSFTVYSTMTLLEIGA
jgi:hypothetical protein